jgi:hypothetical protein
MPDFIKQRISEGEHQRLEFKFEVSDFRKIARTLVAFSNTDGGSLLIGVKDNGAIAGIRSDEEYFMIDGAAKIYCRPEVPFRVREWQTEGRRVLEIIIQAGSLKPYLAQDETGAWVAYIRQGDQNFRAGKVALQVWERKRSGMPATIKFRQAEQLLLHYLEANKVVSISKFRRIAGITSHEAEEILVGFTLLDIIRAEHSLTSVTFSLTEGYKKIVDRLTGKNGVGY